MIIGGGLAAAAALMAAGLIREKKQDEKNLTVRVLCCNARMFYNTYTQK